jgi:hypothetical protein
MKAYTEPDTGYELISNSFGRTYRVFYMAEFIGHVQKVSGCWIATPDRLPKSGASSWGSLLTEAEHVRSMLRTRHEAFLWLLGIRDAAQYNQ